MLCYPCDERGIDQPTVALCRSYGAGVASSHMLDTCQHDTSTLTGPPSGASNDPEAGSQP
jgi:hypothetical protein